MSRAASARTDALLKIYLGLFAVSVVLCGVLAERRLLSLARRGDAVAIAVPRETPHGYGPTINWGGAKR
jgi:hypothetical protein